MPFKCIKHNRGIKYVVRKCNRNRNRMVPTIKMFPNINMWSIRCTVLLLLSHCHRIQNNMNETELCIFGLGKKSSTENDVGET